MTTTAPTPAETEGIASEVARLVGEQYVFADDAATISGHILSRVASDGYASLDLPTLAEALTVDLQSVNGDRHLRVLYTDEPVVDLADTDAELAMWTARSNADAGGIATVQLLPGGIGLLEVRPILYPAVLSGDRIASAMTRVADSAALVIDVRGCKGGSPDAVTLLCSYLFDDDPVHLTTMVGRDEGDTEESWTLSEVAGRRFGRIRPVVVLTGPQTFSGGEAIAYDLQQAGRALVVGERTGGGANPRQGYRVHEHLEATIPVARPVNPVSGTNWELVGVTPDIPVPATHALESALDELAG